jgi:hypothetical protein
MMIAALSGLALLLLARVFAPETPGPHALSMGAIALGAAAMAPLAYSTIRDTKLDWFERTRAGIFLVGAGCVTLIIIVAGLATCAGVL